MNSNMFAIAIVAAFVFLHLSEAVYFAHRKPELCLHIPAESGTIVGRVYAYPNVNSGCGMKTDHSDVITYDVVGDNAVFAINSTGFVYLKTSLPKNATGPSAFEVSAFCKGRNGVVVTSATTKITVNYHGTEEDSQLATNQIIPDKSTIDHICFSHFSDDSTFVVEENVKDIVIGRLNTCWQDRKYERKYQIEKPKSRFSIDPSTSEITVKKQLDRESLGDNKDQPDRPTGTQPLKITCEVKIDDITYTSEKHRLNITVLDVNDNPPRFHLHNGLQHITEDIEVRNGSMHQSLDDIDEVIEDIDADSYPDTCHVKRIITDELNVCKPDLHCVNPKQASSVCRLRIHLQNIDTITDTLYKCEIAVVDTKFIAPDAKPANNSATIVINIHKPSDDTPTAMSLKSTQIFTFYRNSTRLARLHTMRADVGTSTRYSLKDAIFNITPKTGIIYVENTEALAVAPDRYSITISQTGGPSIAIDISLQGTGRTSALCEEGCSRHESTRSCTGSCGVGLTSGGCVMRGSDRNNKMSKDYGTCTHEISTCPDLFCDELEDKFPHLCPQDCTDDVSGAYIMRKSMGRTRGIAMAESPCWCDEDNGIYCTCMSPHEPNAVVNTTGKNVEDTPDHPLHDKPKATTSKVSTGVDAGYAFKKTPTILQQAVTHIENDTYYTDTIDQPPLCDNVCGVAIGVGLTMFLLISFSLFMLWFTKKKNDRRKTNMKHVGSVVSISGLPSDYQDERERRLSYSSDHWSQSQKGPIYSTQIQYTHEDNEKWEISRENLTLEKTIGEGEFGLVVKAKMAEGDKNVRNVAIKMLKHCSTQLEEQDLWSEYNLLKDVSHPNVIRLVGACTKDGPFYLVVEFCQHGCLLKYLRRSRLEENGYVNSGMRLKSPNLKEQTDQDLTGDLLSMRDLLSFSWQIAKGMGYLSEIKLVHRDLAARNILVASDKMLKISDFGLTRDVYEADTYLKKSKGRIPVKWLAPESLYAQIYTTRSDIWSYGIVLWELVTLGAPPYPGIPPERLYNLLIGGYRMDRPENCPDEMYAVMQKCWKIDAADRPSFATLARIFDRILQEKTGYLDLSQNSVRISDLYNKCFNSNLNDKEEGNIRADNVPVVAYDDDEDDSNDKCNIFTVCNETYTADNYLIPTPSSHQSCDPDHTLPLLETRVTEMGGVERGKSDTCKDNEKSSSKTKLDVNDLRKNNKMSSDEQKEGNNNLIEHMSDNTTTENRNMSQTFNGVTTSHRVQEPMFRKKTENSLPTIRYTKNNKNKHVIYPSENVALLTENGSARCIRDNDSNEQETSQL